MNARKLAGLALPFVLVAAVVVWVAWHRAPDAVPVVPDAVPVVPEPVPRVLEGRVLDEGGLPVPDASVQLFGHAGVWLDGEDGGCELSLLACDSISAGRQVLQQLDGGTLVFPAAIAHTATDGDGRFSLREVRADQFVVASDGRQGAVQPVPPSGPLWMQFAAPLDTLSVRHQQNGWPGVRVTVINPFTRDVVHAESADFGTVAAVVPAMERTWVVAEPEGMSSTVLSPSKVSRQLVTALAHPLKVQLDFDGGAIVDGTFELRCEGFTRQARSIAGVLHFEDVVAHYCHVSGRAGDFGTRDVVSAWLPEATVQMEPQARLRVTLIGKGLGSGEVLVWPPDTGGLSVFDSPIARTRFEHGAPAELSALKVRPLVVVTVDADGFSHQRRETTLKQGLNELSFTLEPVRVVRGVVHDATNRPVAGAEVNAFAATRNAWLSRAQTNDAGAFALAPDTDEPVRLVATHRSVGAAGLTLTNDDPVVLSLRATSLVIVHAPVASLVRVSRDPVQGESLEELARTGVVTRAPVSLMEDEHWLELSPDDAGVARVADAAPGLHRVLVTQRGFGPEEVEVRVPDAGVVEVSVTLAPGAVLMGTLLLDGAPMAGLKVAIGELAPRGGIDEQRVISNAQGRFRFEDLRAGPHLVVVSDEADRRFEFDAGAPDLSLRVELPP